MIYRRLRAEEAACAAVQVLESYRAAYDGLMDPQYLAALREDHWLPVLRESLDRGDTCLVADDGGRIVGTAVFGAPDGSAPPDCAAFHAIYLSPAYVGRGVGRGLYAALEGEMRAQGWRACRLEALAANRTAVRFYEARGFRSTGTFAVAENGMTLDCVGMEKRL